MSEDNATTSFILSPTPTRAPQNNHERNGVLSTGSSPPAPQALLSSAAALSPGLPLTTTPPIPHKPPSSSPSPSSNSVDSQRTPRARQTSSSNSRLLPPDHQQTLHNTLSTSSSRPTSQTSFISTASSSLNSPLCTPKVRDFAYPKTHKYHAPSFNNRRYSISSRSSTSSDLDSFFPQRIVGAGPLYIADEGWKQEVGDEDQRVDEGFDEAVDGEEEIVERRAVCVFEFTAECEGEIGIEIGQVVWVEFRKGVSGWLVVRDEITGISLLSLHPPSL